MRRHAILLTALSVSACYRYAPIEMQGVRPLDQVVVELTDQGTASVAPLIGSYATSVEGRVVARDDAGLTISLLSVRRRGEAPSDWSGEKLALRTSDVRAVRTKAISPPRTVAAVAGLTAAGTALVVMIARAVGAASTTGTGPGGPPTP